jgi:hypothetical protein
MRQSVIALIFGLASWAGPAGADSWSQLLTFTEAHHQQLDEVGVNETFALLPADAARELEGALWWMHNNGYSRKNHQGSPIVAMGPYGRHPVKELPAPLRGWFEEYQRYITGFNSAFPELAVDTDRFTFNGVLLLPGQGFQPVHRDHVPLTYLIDGKYTQQPSSEEQPNRGFTSLTYFRPEILTDPEFLDRLYGEATGGDDGALDRLPRFLGGELLFTGLESPEPEESGDGSFVPSGDPDARIDRLRRDRNQGKGRLLRNPHRSVATFFPHRLHGVTPLESEVGKRYEALRGVPMYRWSLNVFGSSSQAAVLVARDQRARRMDARVAQRRAARR